MKRITTIEELDAMYGAPVGAAVVKEIDYISDHYKAFIDKAPFVVLATVGPEGLDCSPRGDPAGFVRVRDKKTVMIPDRRGNNRVDALRNLVRDPRISLLFMIPGIGSTLRINGTAEIVVDPELNASFAMNGKLPKCVLVVTADRVYTQCPKALVRSRLWSADSQIDRSELPSAGEMIAALSKGTIDGDEYDRAYPAAAERDDLLSLSSQAFASGVNLTARTDARGWLDPGDKHRDDNCELRAVHFNRSTLRRNASSASSTAIIVCAWRKPWPSPANSCNSTSMPRRRSLSAIRRDCSGGTILSSRPWNRISGALMPSVRLIGERASNTALRFPGFVPISRCS